MFMISLCDIFKKIINKLTRSVLEVCKKSIKASFKIVRGSIKVLRIPTHTVKCFERTQEIDGILVFAIFKTFLITICKKYLNIKYFYC